MSNGPVRASKYVSCICGKECKGRAARANHGKKCPVERARSAAFVEAIQSGRKTPTDAEFLATYRPR